LRHEHCGDIAEAYALGILDDAERVAVEEHLRECPTCAQLVSAAESDVALIASMEPQSAAPSELRRRIDRLFHNERWSSLARIGAAPFFPTAIAAALVIGLLPSIFFWSETRAMHAAMLAQNAAMERIVAQPHRTATFAAMPPATMAQVAYAPNGSWYVVIVRGISKPLSVAWLHEGGRTILGDAVPHGNLAMLYLPTSHRMDRLALMDGDRVVAQTSLSWEKTTPNRQDARSS
jgi:anti-sigma factor RsiW